MGQTGTCFADTSESAEAKVGAVLSLSGIAASHGSAIRDGVEFAAEQLAKQGRKRTVLFEDDASTAKQTVSAVERLGLSGVRFVIGPTWGVFAMPSEPAFRRMKMLSLQPANSSDFVSGSNEQFFFILSPPSSAKGVIVDYLKKLPDTKVALLSVASEWGNLWQKLFQEAAKESAKEVVLDELPQFSDLDSSLSTFASRMRQKKATVLLSTTWSQGTAITVAALEKQQLAVKFLSPDLNEAVNEGLVKGESAFVEGSTIIPKENAQFVSDFEKAKGRKPKKYTDTGYDALMILDEALKNVGNDPDAVKKYLLEKLDSPGVSGRLKFKASHDVEGAGYEVRQVVVRTAR